jgi:hypothetical protein
MDGVVRVLARVMIDTGRLGCVAAQRIPHEYCGYASINSSVLSFLYLRA